MTQDEIIEMAQECRLIGMRPHLDGIYSEALEAFAKMVAEKALAEKSMREVQRIGQEIEQERTWVNLTDEDRNDCLVEADPCECLATPEAQELMRCVEAKSRSKNQ